MAALSQKERIATAQHILQIIEIYEKAWEAETCKHRRVAIAEALWKSVEGSLSLEWVQQVCQGMVEETP